jgi:multiple sugar transport system permease protein
LIAPYLGHQAVFFGYALLWLVFLTFHRWNYLSPPQWYGLNNFVQLFNDQTFWLVVGNTFNFIAYYIPMVLILSILFAMGLSKLRYLTTFVALSFLVANVASGVSYSIVFTKLFSENGPINRFLWQSFGFTIPWFSEPQLAIFSIALMVTWKFIGYYGLIFLAGIQGIPKSLYEAAELDGANRRQKFFKITLPLLNPSMIMVIVMAITLSFGIFTEPYMITGGGPMRRTYTFMMFIYDNAFRRFTTTGPGYAATISILAAALSFSCIFAIRKIMERDVEMI